jgi:hypothetical protein
VLCQAPKSSSAEAPGARGPHALSVDLATPGTLPSRQSFVPLTPGGHSAAVSRHCFPFHTTVQTFCSYCPGISRACCPLSGPVPGPWIPAGVSTACAQCILGTAWPSGVASSPRARGNKSKPVHKHWLSFSSLHIDGGPPPPPGACPLSMRVAHMHTWPGSSSGPRPPLLLHELGQVVPNAYFL